MAAIARRTRGLKACGPPEGEMVRKARELSVPLQFILMNALCLSKKLGLTHPQLLRVAGRDAKGLTVPNLKPEWLCEASSMKSALG